MDDRSGVSVRTVSPESAAIPLAPVSGSSSVLVVSTGVRRCALPIGRVIETMRPLPIEAVAGAPPFVLGVALVRGQPTPVIDLGAMLGGSASAAPRRFVTVDAGGRQVALAVDEVMGVRQLVDQAGAGVPPLLAEATAGTIETLSRLDAGLLAVLRTGFLLAEEQG